MLRQRHPFSSNANALVRTAAWEQLRYREELTGLEDLDFAKRAIESGDFIAYVAEAPVVHVHEESWEVIQNRYRREAIAYKNIYPDAEMTRAASHRARRGQRRQRLVARGPRAQAEGELRGHRPLPDRAVPWRLPGNGV